MFSRYDARIRPPGKNSSHQLRAAFCNRDKPTFHWARCEQAKKKDEVGLSNSFASKDGPSKRRERAIFFPSLSQNSWQMNLSSPAPIFSYLHLYLRSLLWTLWWSRSRSWWCCCMELFACSRWGHSRFRQHVCQRLHRNKRLEDGDYETNLRSKSNLAEAWIC